jgi:predicted transcriptional regulator
VRPVRAVDENETRDRWTRTRVGRTLMNRKHALAIMVFLYERRMAATSSIIRHVKGRPATVLKAIHELDDLGVLCMAREMQLRSRGRPMHQMRLTLKGMQLVETPIYRWPRLIRKWDRVT